jgi:DNA repair exonuclease SbcCD ATPase subunit
MAELEECSRLLGMDNHEGLTNVAGRLGTRLDADFDKLIALEARVAEYQTGMGESTAQIASLTYKLENTTNEWTAYLEALDQCATHLGLPAIASRLSVPDNLRHRLDANDSALKLHRDESVKLSARCEKLDETARQHLHEISELRNELYKGNNAAYAGADNLNAAAIAEIQRLQDVEGKHRDEISLLNTLLDKVAPGWSEVVDDRRAAVTDAIEGLAQQLKQYDAGSPEQRAAADRGKSAESQLQEIRAVLDRFVPGWGEDIEDLSNEVVVAVQRLVAKKPKPLWTSLEWANVHFAGGQRIVGFVVPALPAPALDTANRLPAIIDGTDPVYLNLPTAS